ncbi:2-oxoglutarate ferredoxin oxidoreductase subunit beta [Desulfacinum hydrothermale DSM 13146]|uniref:2-oxoglutarate ferredoxin oxidoreductase subunit beta n=1 Tax=Desulfacinum hydrothermale DSM 13146 TaxID=1121390 RepID=A0A1W1XLM5_9BACT|nr:thiamine pyrophosphate-dependent enzyme [Desulfacinum hydrothermale]SMC24451.1 2-oxoglutarate ferredoxin oxidoreductase subunit beta [Desulfacinum hydrothermale DSM 13146]
MNVHDPFQNDVEIQWCPGCPNFGILTALKRAFVDLQLEPHQVCLVSGIGQAAKLPHYLRCNFFNGLHGRAIPVALGIHAANPTLTTVVTTGEGDCYGEGGNHLLHAFRRNPNMTVVVHNNEIYALTKGQGSPTTPVGEVRSLQVHGVEMTPLNMPAVAVLHDGAFVARGFAADPDHLKDLLVEAVRCPGLSLVEVIQPCITWGPHPVSWYKERLRPVPTDHDPTNREAALRLLLGQDGRFVTGVIYRGTERPLFGHRFRSAVGNEPLGRLGFPENDVVRSLLDKFRAH